MEEQKRAYKIIIGFYRDFFDFRRDSRFKYVAIMYGTLAATNVVTAFFNNRLLSNLAASSNQWWGDITSLGLYDTVGSIAGLLLLILMFALVNSRLDKDMRESRSLLFSVFPFLSAIVANIIWTSIPTHLDSATYGSSGTSVAADGFLIVISFSNLVQTWAPNGKRTVRIHFADPFDKKFWIVVNLVVFASMLAYPLVLQPVYIPSKVVNMFVHSVCILLGLAAGLAFVGAEYLHAVRFRSLAYRED